MYDDGKLKIRYVSDPEEGRVSVVVHGETIMMSVRNGRYYGLNGTGTRIWCLLEQPRTLASLCEVLQADYDVERETCEREVLLLLEALVHEGLVRTDNF
jgi:hypothetical protein